MISGKITLAVQRSAAYWVKTCTCMSRFSLNGCLRVHGSSIAVIQGVKSILGGDDARCVFEISGGGG